MRHEIDFDAARNDFRAASEFRERGMSQSRDPGLASARGGCHERERGMSRARDPGLASMRGGCYDKAVCMGHEKRPFRRSSRSVSNTGSARNEGGFVSVLQVVQQPCGFVAVAVEGERLIDVVGVLRVYDLARHETEGLQLGVAEREEL